jgi:hypothetical protein
VCHRGTPTPVLAGGPVLRRVPRDSPGIRLLLTADSHLPLYLTDALQPRLLLLQWENPLHWDHREGGFPGIRWDLLYSVKDGGSGPCLGPLDSDQEVQARPRGHLGRPVRMELS